MYKKSYKPDTFTIEEHPFKTYVPDDSTKLIIGTFPTHTKNFRYNFFYSGKDNLFWEIIESVFNSKFKFDNGIEAVTERQKFLEQKKIGITDMLKKCYRRNNMSTDESLFPILWNNIFEILDSCKTIDTLIFTSRTPVFGALGHFKTFCLQNDFDFKEPQPRKDKVLEGNFIYKERVFKMIVPYSPSPRVIESGNTTKFELFSMYKTCLG